MLGTTGKSCSIETWLGPAERCRRDINTGQEYIFRLNFFSFRLHSSPHPSEKHEASRKCHSLHDYGSLAARRRCSLRCRRCSVNVTSLDYTLRNNYSESRETNGEAKVQSETSDTAGQVIVYRGNLDLDAQFSIH